MKKEVKKEVKASKIVGQTDVKKMLAVAAKRNYPALLVAETGTGKTSIIQDLADQADKPWVRFNLTGDTTVDEFVGKYTLRAGETVWEDGILIQAMKNGHWLIVDEINVALPEILFALHSLLDDDRFVVVANHRGEVVRPHEDFRFFATMNPVEEYAGTKELNKAFQSRFTMIITLVWPGKKDEIKIVTQHTGIGSLTAAKIVDVASLIRRAKQDNKIFYTCSTRDLIHWAKLIDDLDVEKGFNLAVLNKAPQADRKILIETYDKLMGRYTTLEQEVKSELTIEWFEAKYKTIVEAEATIEAKVRDELRKKLSGIV